jgi:uncharacterized OsmC-like protein
MVLTMAAVADNKGMHLTELAATVEGRTEFESGHARTHFSSRFDLGDGLTRREVRILYNSARQCEVHKMLRGEISFDEQLSSSWV